VITNRTCPGLTLDSGKILRDPALDHESLFTREGTRLTRLIREIIAE
jgi:hypothetical protein